MQKNKIKLASANNHKKCIVIKTILKGELSLPYSLLRYVPSRTNKIISIFPDAEIQNEGIIYCLQDGTEDTIHLDVFLNHNKDPEYLRENTLYELTIHIQKQKKKFKISTSELARRLRTSRSQIHRLLDQTNYDKSLDAMFELGCAVGLDFNIKYAA